MKSHNVSFIGAGNLAWHLAPALDNTDFAVREIFSQNPAHATALAERLYEVEVKSSLDFSTSESHVFIIAVTDDAIPEIVREIILPENPILIHTSGSQPLNLLAYAATSRIGVMYPLQTFTKGRKVDFREVPLFIEAEDTETERVLMKMAEALSKKVHKVSSQDRKTIHLAAVFASNFSNHMLTLAKDILHANELSFDYLKPLIAETINKAISIGPELAQTGPARRGDLEILDKHLALLAEDEALAEIYKVISQHIVDHYSE